MKNVTVEFTVTGKYPFPLDMLRYDSCWPANPQAVSDIETSLRQYDVPASDRPQQYSITLRSKSHSAPTTGRWKSFGWEVTEVK